MTGESLIRGVTHSYDTGSIRPCSPFFPPYIGVESPSLASRQAIAVELVTKVCFSLFDGSEVLARLTPCIRKGSSATCGASETLHIYIYT